MAVIETWLHQDADSLVEVVPLKGNLFYGDDGGNLIGVEVTRAGAAVSLPSGCYGYGILSNGTTEYISGTVSGNRAYVILPKEWCACVGPISIVIKTGATMQAVPNEGTKPVGGVTLAACTGYVYKTRTDTIVDPGSALPDIGQLEAAIANCIAATTNAEKVNISQSKSGNTITVTTTNRNGQSTNQTLTEPTVSVTKHGTTDPVPAREGDFDITVRSPNASGNMVTNTVTIPNPNAELSDRAHVNTVSRLKTRKGNPIKIEDAVNEIADKTVIKLVPKQDLHGFSRPWVGGAGRNKIPMTVAGIKAANTGTWNGNSITIANVTYTILTDESGNVIGIQTSGTANSDSVFFLCNLANTFFESGEKYTLSGCPANGGTSVYKLDIVDRKNNADVNEVIDTGNGSSFTVNADMASAINLRFRIVIYNGKAAPGIFYPMVRDFAITDGTFEPYSNICPISGYDTVNTFDCGKNLATTEVEKDGYVITNNGETNASASQYFITFPIRIYPEKKYTVSFTRVSGEDSLRIGYYDEYLNFISRQSLVDYRGITLTVPENAKYIKFSYMKNLSSLKNVQLEEGTVATSYSESSTAYPIAVSLATNGNQTAGTVYSGTVTLLADGSGQVKSDHAIGDLGSLTWQYSNGIFIAQGFSGQKSPASESVVQNMVCSALPVIPAGDVAGLNTGIGGRSNGWYRAYYPGCGTDATAFKTAMTGQTLCYELATPLTFTLTANQVQTLLGYNYIYTDGAEIALTYRQESLATNETLLKLLPTGSASGNPVTFSDGANDVPLKQLVVNVEPKQEGSGTPSPTNIRPIRGWDSVPLLQTGKNLIAITATSGTVSNVAVTVNNDGTVKLHGTANADGTITLASGIQTKGGEQYWLTGCPSEGVYNSTYWLNYFGVGVDEDGNDAYLMFNSSGSLSGGIAASEPDLTGTVSIKFKNGTVFNNVVFSPMLYNSSLSRDFEPGVKKTYSIALPSEAGTVYGCQIVLDENGEGELKVNRAIADFGNMTWNYVSNKYFQSSDLTSVIKKVSNNDELSGAISSAYRIVAWSDSSATSGCLAVNTTGVISCINSSYSDVASFKAGNAGVQLAYELATPLTFALTADQVKTLLGTNIISSDAGNVEVEYFQKLSDKGTGEYSHVEGRSTIASGLASHAEGDATKATGQSSHAEGKGTIANHLAQHVFGIFNVADPSTAAATAKGNYVEIVGNGESVSAKHNARTLDWNGNEWLAGSLTLGNTTLTEAKLAELVSISSATGVTF